MRPHQYSMSDLIQESNNKKFFKDHLPQLLINNSNDYNIYFSTFTFKNTKVKASYDAYREYFHYMRAKLDQYTLSHPKQSTLKPMIILIPEVSKNNHTDKHMNFTCLHFHGFVLIHKKTNERFMRKCVEKAEIDECSDQSIVLNQKLLNPYPIAIKENNLNMEAIKAQSVSVGTYEQKKALIEMRPLLEIQSHKIYQLTDVSDLYATSQYSAKSFLHSDFNYNQVIIELKLSRQQN